MSSSHLDCSEVIASLHVYLDGEMVDCDALEAHLTACVECFTQVGFERDLKAKIKRACGEGTLPPELEAKVRSLLS